MVRGNLLEIGVGGAYCLDLLCAEADLTVGVDHDLDCIVAAAGRRLPARPQLLVADACSLPFPAVTYQTVTCFEVIEHVATLAAMLQQIRRVLSPDGVLLMSTPNKAVCKCTTLTDHHVSNFDHRGFMDLLRSHFDDVALYGEGFADARLARAFALECGTLGYLVLRAKRLLGVTRALLSSKAGIGLLRLVQCLACGATCESSSALAEDIIFDHAAVGTSPYLLAVCRSPRQGE